MPARPHAFPRSRRLKRRRLLRPLFDRARPDVGRVRVGTVALLYRAVLRSDTGEDTPFQVCFAPGRAARGAGRVRLRRVMRETFRLHQHGLLDAFADRPDCLTLVVLFRGRAVSADRDLARDLPDALRRLAARTVPPAEDTSPTGPQTAGRNVGDGAS